MENKSNEIIINDINKINTKDLGFLAKHGYHSDNTYHILKKEHMEYVNNILLKDILEKDVDKKYYLSKEMINNLLYNGE